MSALRYTLLTDGASDRCLVWIINSSLDAISEVATRGYIPQVADLRQFSSPAKLPGQTHLTIGAATVRERSGANRILDIATALPLRSLRQMRSPWPNSSQSEWFKHSSNIRAIFFWFIGMPRARPMSRACRKSVKPPKAFPHHTFPSYPFE